MAQTLHSSSVRYHQSVLTSVISLPWHQEAKSSIAIELEMSQRWIDFQYAMKRVLDFSFAFLGLLFLAPLLLITAIAIKLDSPGPVFYLSERIGKDFKPFKMWKFRTMKTNAEAEREQLRQQQNLEGQLFKMKDDPRITPFGRLLRKTSLDELPQLVNVVLGQMSLVGPRPLPEDESVLFESPYTKRFSVLPGITGAWQVFGRSDADFNRLCQLEYAHLSQWNLFKDISLLFQTIPAVLMSKGAY